MGHKEFIDGMFLECAADRFQPNGKVSSYNIISLYALSENFFKN